MAEDRDRLERQERERQERERQRREQIIKEDKRRTTHDHDIEKKTTDWRKPISPIKPKT